MEKVELKLKLFEELPKKIQDFSSLFSFSLLLSLLPRPNNGLFILLKGLLSNRVFILISSFFSNGLVPNKACSEFKLNPPENNEVV